MNNETAKIEKDLLLEAVYRCYGYDFRSYSEASVGRRINQFLAGTGCDSISAMIPRIIHDQSFFARFVHYLSIPVTEVFRDPFFYKVVRENVVPLLKTWPHVKIWVAGCATGEEVYSLAIVLREEGLLERATIYATDFNDEAIKRGIEGRYEIGKLRDATRNYQQAGGKTSFSDYYHACYGAALIDASLKKRIVFSTHNLATDSVFGEMHLIFCRNVLIYFNRKLQDRVLELFSESLVHGGFLCLGTKEDIRFSSAQDKYEAVDKKAKIYRKLELKEVNKHR